MFATALLTAGLVCLQRLPERWEVPCLGITIGLVTAANPLPGVMLFLIASVFLCVKYKAVPALIRVALTGLLMLIVFLTPFLFYPYPFHDWLSGMIFRSKQELGRTDTGKFLYYFFLNPGETFLGTTYFLGLCAALFLTFRHQQTTKFRAGVIIFSLLLGIVIYKTALRAPVRNYGLLVLTPIIFALIVQAVNNVLSTRNRLSRPIICTTIFLIALGGIGFIRGVVAFPSFVKAGLPYQQGRLALSQLRRQYPGTLGITSGLFTLTEDYKGISGYERGSQPATDDLMFQQTNTGLLQPPVIPGYQIIENTFSTKRVLLCGIKIANTPQGYNYAFYTRKQ